MLSKKMKRPALAVEIRSGGPGKTGPGSERDEDEGDDEDDDGYASMFGSPKGGDDDGGGADDGDGGDGDEGGDMDDLHGEPDDENSPGNDDGDGDEGASGEGGSRELTPHELAHTSLADASYEQLMAAADMKKPKDDDEDGGDMSGSGDRPESDPSQIV